ncbi:MAG: histidine--tRNA ligase [Nitrospirae bacterium]|nr:histidine--tRNA ligase [Nitrospirota bacterium]MBF0540660.1 histidine--tRNA ligase [Nitrospirota bacterium]
MNKYSTLKGVCDIVPPDDKLWDFIEEISKEVFSIYGFKNIRIPVIEYTELFKRGIGEGTDIVEKEMYTFSDRSGRSITLRPEGTASVVRSYIENNLSDLPSPQKFFYLGPMFRYERPQKGRYRQFYQIGAEVFGSSNPSTDAEIFSMLNMFLDKVGLTNTQLQINSIGCPICRPNYISSLIEFFSKHSDNLCTDCQNRLQKNPLRLLDCKNEGCGIIKKDAPLITQSLCGECVNHHNQLKHLLDLQGISFIENPLIVRGLDYYTKTAFEITADHIGAQNTVIAGGRYDNLVHEFGGAKTPAIGFAIGLERLALLLKDKEMIDKKVPLIYFAILGDKALDKALLMAKKYRKEGLWVEIGNPSDSLKSQMKKADKFNAESVIIIGENEINSGIAIKKRMNDGVQEEVNIN